MKPNRDAKSLAEALTNAAAAPVPLPARPEPQQPADDPAPSRSTRSKTKAQAQPEKPEKPDTVGITLRPERSLWLRYIREAAERSGREGRTISAQQVMLEVLARGLKAKP